MKKIYLTVMLLTLLLLFNSCKKDIPVGGDDSSVNIINAVVGSNPITGNFSGIAPVSTYTYSPTATQIAYASSSEYTVPSGNVPITLYQFGDSTHAIFRQTFNLIPRGIYSLYLSGNNPQQPDTLFLKDNIPYLNADTVSDVRFINLVSDSQPVSVNIKGNANGSEVQSLSYRKITAFKSHPGTSVYASNGYTFEIRDATTGNLLTTFTWAIKPFYCNTIVVAGSELGAPGITAFQINNY